MTTRTTSTSSTPFSRRVAVYTLLAADCDEAAGALYDRLPAVDALKVRGIVASVRGRSL